MLLAQSINPSAPAMFHAPFSPYAWAYKPPKGGAGVRFAETRLSDSDLICQNDCQGLKDMERVLLRVMGLDAA